MTVVDTNFLIDLDQSDPAAHRLLGDISTFGTGIQLPAAVWIEYLVGWPGDCKLAAKRTLEHSTSFVPLDRAIADEAVTLQAQCLAEGRRLAWSDLQVAATARHLGAELVTNDEAFRDIDGLVVHRY